MTQTLFLKIYALLHQIEKLQIMKNKRHNFKITIDLARHGQPSGDKNSAVPISVT